MRKVTAASQEKEFYLALENEDFERCEALLKSGVPPIEGAELGKLLHSGNLNYKQRLFLIDIALSAEVFEITTNKTERDIGFVDLDEYNEFLLQDTEMILEEALAAKDYHTSVKLIGRGTILEEEPGKKKYLKKEVRDFYNEVRASLVQDTNYERQESSNSQTSPLEHWDFGSLDNVRDDYKRFPRRPAEETEGATARTGATPMNSASNLSSTRVSRNPSKDDLSQS